jgi:hypothetical protein
LTEALKKKEEEEEEEEDEASSFPAGCCEGRRTNGNLAASLALNSTGYLISQKQTLWSVCSYYVWSVCKEPTT